MSKRPKIEGMQCILMELVIETACSEVRRMNRQWEEISRIRLRYQGRLCLVIILLVTLPLARSQEISGSASGLEIVERHVLDVADAKIVKGNRYLASHEYQPTVSPSGTVALVRHGNLAFKWDGPVNSSQYDELVRGIFARDEKDYADVAIHVGGKEGWQSISLSGAGPYLIFDEPRILFDPAGTPYIVWVKRTLEEDTWHEILVARALTGETSATLVLSPKGSSVDSFSSCVGPGSGFEVLWSEDSDSHASEGKTDSTRSRIYTRRVSVPNSLGSIQQVSPKRGNYDARPVKAAADANGSAYALWDRKEPKSGAQLFLAVRRGGDWGDPVQISADLPSSVKESESRSYAIPTLHVDFSLASPSQDTAVIVWSGSGETRGIYGRVYSKGRLGPIALVSKAGSNVQTAGTPDGAVHLTYEKEEQVDDDTIVGHERSLICHREWRAGTWSDESVIATTAFRESSRVYADRQGRVHLFWQEFEGGKASLVHSIARPKGNLAQGQTTNF